MEPHGFTAVVPPRFGEIPPKHPRQNAAGLSLAFILPPEAGGFLRRRDKIPIALNRRAI